LDYVFWIVAIGVVATLLSYDFKKEQVRWKVFVCGMSLVLGAPFLGQLVQTLDATDQLFNVVIGLLVLFLGFVVADFSKFAIQNSAPESRNLLQFLAFGFCKWDDYSELFILGALIGFCAFGYVGLEIVQACIQLPPQAACSAPIVVPATKRVAQSDTGSAVPDRTAKHLSATAHGKKHRTVASGSATHQKAKAK
jgi:hypothetical protein